MPLLPYDPAPLRAPCAELDDWRARLDRAGALPRRWAGRLRSDFEAEAVAASVSMEQVPVTVDEVRRILAGERPATVRDEDQALVRGYRDAMEFVFTRAGRDAWRPARVGSLTIAPAPRCPCRRLPRTSSGSSTRPASEWSRAMSTRRSPPAGSMSS